MTRIDFGPTINILLIPAKIAALSATAPNNDYQADKPIMGPVSLCTACKINSALEGRTNNKISLNFNKIIEFKNRFATKNK